MKLTIGTDSRGKAFSLPLDLTTQTVAVLARKGAGKSYTAAVFNEELLDAGQVPVIIDPTGAHWGLKSSADGKDAGYPVVIFGGEHADIPLEEGSGEATARVIVEQRFPAIIDLSLMRKGQVRRFITPFMETLYRLNREPLMLVIDEADDLCPQKPFGDEAQMVGAIEDVVKRGRKKGIGCTLITQRPADLAKQVLTQCEVLVAMRLVHPLDIKAIMERVHVHADEKTAAEMVASLPSLPTGTAWFWSPGWGDIFERVAVRKRRTFDSGATPKPGEKASEPKKRAEIDIAALGKEIAATAERAKANDPKELQARIRQLEAAAKVALPVETKIETQEVPVLSDEQTRLLERLEREAGVLSAEAKHFQEEVNSLILQVQAKTFRTPKVVAPAVVRQSFPAVALRRPRTETADGMDNSKQRILDVVAMLSVRGINANRDSVARWLDLHPNGGSYGTSLYFHTDGHPKRAVVKAEQGTLFALPVPDGGPAPYSIGARSNRLSAFTKKHGILTHDAGRDFEPKNARWMAVKVPPKRLDNGEPIEGMSVGEMMAHFCRLLDEGGWTGTGPTKFAAVIECAENQKIPIDLA